MRMKSKVTERFPLAHLQETSPRHWTVMAGDGSCRYLDVYDENPNMWQPKIAAWRSAFYWLARNPTAKAYTKEDMAAAIKKGPITA